MAELDLRLDRERLDRVRHGATVVSTTPAVVRIVGPGALACLQGLLTNDLEKPGDGSLVYGALLTPKGMIVVDAWVLRQGDSFTLIIPIEWFIWLLVIPVIWSLIGGSAACARATATA